MANLVDLDVIIGGHSHTLLWTKVWSLLKSNHIVFREFYAISVEILD